MRVDIALQDAIPDGVVLEVRGAAVVVVDVRQGVASVVDEGRGLAFPVHLGGEVAGWVVAGIRGRPDRCHLSQGAIGPVIAEPSGVLVRIRDGLAVTAVVVAVQDDLLTSIGNRGQVAVRIVTEPSLESAGVHHAITAACRS
jgi:hypothetical protein